MGADASKEQEETKQKEIQLQIEQVRAKQRNKDNASKLVQKQQEINGRLAMKKKFCVIHGGVTVANDGTPHLTQTILTSDTEEGFEVCYNLFYLNRKEEKNKGLLRSNSMTKVLVY